jgi:RimJ/RimL family protein N-acetyltransferase
MQVTYTGEKVRIRPFRDFAEIDSVHVQDYAIPDPFRGPRWWPVSAREAEFDKHGMLDHERYSMSAIERLDTGAVVGISGCSPYRSGLLSMNIGTFVMRAHRARGFGIEAKQLLLCRLFESYPLTAVRASTMEHHAAACRSLEASGLRCYGRLRAIEWTDGQCHDELEYEIFREEWEQLPIRQIVRRGQS